MFVERLPLPISELPMTTKMMLSSRNINHDPLEEDITSASVVPQVSLLWFLAYSCTSNSDLASLSNVNKWWRQVTLKFLRDAFRAEVQLRDYDKYDHNEYSQVLKLLLPDMALEIAKRRLSSMRYTSPFVSQESSSFCLAWFHPKGIKIKSIDLTENYDDDMSASSSAMSIFGSTGTGGGVSADTGAESLSAHLKSLRQATQRIRNAQGLARRRSKEEKTLCTVTDEWQGYQNATDVLHPFGYSTAFVREFLRFATAYEFDKNILLKESSMSLSLDSRQAGGCDISPLSKQRRTTFAVRGATFARPHGYCLCWEDNRLAFLHGQLEHSKSVEEKSALLKQIRLTEKHERRKMIRMKDALPKAVKSTRSKHPNYQQPFGQLQGKSQRSIQFLNAEKDRAVYMRTHPFDCGPISSPVTVFLVGIATEDGCFVSGLKDKFEIGHMYPRASSASVEMSPICLAVDIEKDVRGDTSNSNSNSSNGSHFRGLSNTSSIIFQDADSDDSSESSETQWEEMVGDMNCRCKIQWRQRYEYESYDDDEDDNVDKHGNNSTEQSDKENLIIHGAIGPGRWHLYTAVFDGVNSTIRIDGVEEPVESLPVSLSSQDNLPTLDGITIGSDHSFDMSLCFGEGSEGEGAGSISELAYFKGKMDPEDITCLENYLMKKHGIVHGSTGFINEPSSKSNLMGDRIGNRWEENQWERDAHSLMINSPPYETTSGGRVPLRVAARHRFVAWHRSCEVTGLPIRVSRIGSKLSTGESSDF